MRIFSSFESSETSPRSKSSPNSKTDQIPSQGKGKGKAKGKGKGPGPGHVHVPHEKLSPDQIREKVQLKGIKTEKKTPIKAVDAGTDKEEGKKVSDGLNALKDNRPDSPETVGKLKDVLKSGGVNFSQKERSVIENLINQ